MKLSFATTLFVLCGLAGSANADGRVLRGSAAVPANKDISSSTVDDAVAGVEDALHRLMQANGADVVGCITITSPDGTVRTVAPCDPNSGQEPRAPDGGSSGSGSSSSDDRRLQSIDEDKNVLN